MAYPTDRTGRGAYWKRHIDFSGEVLEPWLKIGRRQLALYENEASTERERILETSRDGDENTGRVKPSLHFGWVDQSRSNLLSRNPRFRVKAKRKDSVAGEVLVGKIVDHWYDVTGQMHQDRRVLTDAFLYPFGVKKAGWVSDVLPEGETRVSDSVDPALRFDDPEEENLFLGAGTMTPVDPEQDHVDHIEKHTQLKQDPTISDEIVEDTIDVHIAEHEAELDQGQVDAHIGMQVDQPFGLRWNPEDFRIDPLATDGLNDARWIAFRSCKPLDEVKSNPNYKNTSQLKATRMEKAPAPDARVGEGDGFDVVELWEVWARNFPISSRRRVNLLTVVAIQENGDAMILRHEEEWPYKRLKSYPCSLLHFLQGFKTWLQKPILALAGFDNMQTLQNEVLDSYLSVVRKMKNIILYDSDVFQDSEIEIALGAPDSSGVGVPGLSQAQGNPVVPLPFLQIPGDKGEFLNLINSLAYRAAGDPQPAADSDTATEAAINERKNNSREGQRADAFEAYQVDTAEMFWLMHTQFQPEEEILIDPSATEWSTIDAEVAKGAYRFAIDVSSQASTEALERKQWQDVLNLMAGLVEVSPQMPPNLPKIAEQMLIRGFGIQNPAELWPAIGAGEQAVQGVHPAGGAPGGGAGPINPQQFSEPAPSEAAQNGAAQTV